MLVWADLIDSGVLRKSSDCVDYMPALAHLLPIESVFSSDGGSSVAETDTARRIESLAMSDAI